VRHIFEYLYSRKVRSETFPSVLRGAEARNSRESVIMTSIVQVATCATWMRCDEYLGQADGFH